MAESLRGSLSLQLAAGDSVAQCVHHIWHILGAHVVLPEAKGFPQSHGISAVLAPITWCLDACALGPALLLGGWRLGPSFSLALDPSPRRALWQKAWAGQRSWVTQEPCWMPRLNTLFPASGSPRWWPPSQRTPDLQVHPRTVNSKLCEQENLVNEPG